MSAPILSGSAIGVFDSGFGGLNILSALIDLMPRESFVYLGDSLRSPYGDRPPEEVKQFSEQIVDYLVNRYELKLVVVACNTASAVAIDALAARSPVPVIGVIEAGVKAISAASGSREVGVLGTSATINSRAYQSRLSHLKVTAAACPGLVEHVEAGDLESTELRALMRGLLQPVAEAGVDSVLLACTHYPYLAHLFKEILGEEVLLISSAEETAFQVSRVIKSSPVPAESARVEFLCTGDVDEFLRVGRRLFGQGLAKVERVDLLAGEREGYIGDQAS